MKLDAKVLFKQIMTRDRICPNLLSLEEVAAFVCHRVL